VGCGNVGYSSAICRILMGWLNHEKLSYPTAGKHVSGDSGVMTWQ
jgi:hypothetical protein